MCSGGHNTFKKSFNLFWWTALHARQKYEIVFLFVVRYVPNCCNGRNYRELWWLYVSGTFLSLSAARILPLPKGRQGPLPGRRPYTTPSCSPPQHSTSLLTICPPQHCWPRPSWSVPAQQTWFPELEYGILPQQESPMPVDTRSCCSSGQHTSPASSGQQPPLREFKKYALTHDSVLSQCPARANWSRGLPESTPSYWSCKTPIRLQHFCIKDI